MLLRRMKGSTMKYKVRYRCIKNSDLIYNDIPMLVIKYWSECSGFLAVRHTEDIDWFAFKMHEEHYHLSDNPAAKIAFHGVREYCRTTRIQYLCDVVNEHYCGSLDTYIMEFAKYLIQCDRIDMQEEMEYEKAMDTIMFKKWRTCVIEIDDEEKENSDG